MLEIISDSINFGVAVLLSYFLLWVIALIYGQFSRSSLQIERSVLKGWRLAILFHLLIVLGFSVYAIVSLNLLILLFAPVLLALCVILDIIFLVVVSKQIKSLMNFI